MEYSPYTLKELINLGSYAAQIAVLGIMGLYLLFAFILIRRLKIMNLNFRTPHSVLFALIAKIHFIGALIIIILTLLTLGK